MPSPQSPSEGPGPMADMTGEEIVISGISGVFPSSNTTLDFMENLFNQVDMVTTNNMNFDHPEAPKHIGKISGTRKFDAQFFRVTYNQAMSMEPMSRKLLENSYTAMYDSGINPLAYKGRKVGVFIGSSYQDAANYSMYDVMKSKVILSGQAKSMYANRVSFWIDGRGPSYTLDCSCASSMVCLEHAYSAMKSGQCDAALVGGCNACVHPVLSFNLKRGGLLCLDGKTKCFDKNGDGYVRAEAISVLFLQKAKEAKRIYMEVCHTDVQFALKPDAEFLPFRKSEDIEKFLREFYESAKVSPKNVKYVEANASATAEADAQELQAISEIFGKDKTEPVFVGSVKSNMGHSEPASGACSLTKLCLAYHRGEIPANLHFTQPIDILAMKNGKVQVLKENMPFDRSYTAINNFSSAGKNCHALLRGHFKNKDSTRYKCKIPHLVVVSGRQEDCVNKIFDILKREPLDPEVIGMLHNIYKIETPGHTCRGHAILDTNEENETVTLARGVEYYSGTSKPLWLIFSGMGSQWAGMGAALMKIPIFAAAIQRCDKVLAPLGIHIHKVITGEDESIFDEIIHPLVGITAVQIGLIDILKAIGVKADYFLGHSMGEMTCAYWDGCMTLEQLILGAHARGVVIKQSNAPAGAMTAVGMGYKDIIPLCPPEIDIACHNSAESATLSGPAEIMKQFTADLTARGIFAREVQSSNNAFHSRYVQKLGPSFTKKLSAIIKDNKLRSSNWICTSVPQDRWEEPLTKYSSPEYYVNNLLSPVYFEEATNLIPPNAVVLEVGPHGIMQAIVKRSLPECTHISLTRKKHADPVMFLLEAIGKLYEQGFSLQLDSLYPAIDFPVSTETSLLSHYVEWEHSEDWPEAVYQKAQKTLTPSREIVISIKDDDYKFLAGHMRHGKIVFSEAAILVLVWETLAMYLGLNYNQLSVKFSDIQFHSEIIIKAEEPVSLRLMISKGNDSFEVTQNNVLVASGYIAQLIKPNNLHQSQIDDNEYQNDASSLSAKAVYKSLESRGHYYKDSFQTIVSTTIDRITAKVKWDGNWISLIDAMIQLNIYAREHEGISVPKRIQQININIISSQIKDTKDPPNNVIEVKLENIFKVTSCAGIKMKHIHFEDKPVEENIFNVDSLSFMPHFVTDNLSIENALCMILQTIADNVSAEVIRIVELNSDSSQSIFKVLSNGLSKQFSNVNFEIESVDSKHVDIRTLDKYNVVVVQSFLKNGTMASSMLKEVKTDTFILTFEKDNVDYFNKKTFAIISSLPVQEKRLYLLRKVNARLQNDIVYFVIEHDEQFAWVPKVNQALQKSKQVVLVSERDPECGLLEHDEQFAWVPKVNQALQKSKQVVLVSERDPECGLLGLVKLLRKRHNNNISLFIIDDYHALNFDERNKVYMEQLLKNLTFNVYKKSCWGGYYYLPTTTFNTFEHFHLTNTAPGDISSLVWTERNLSSNKSKLIQVHYAGTSVRDSERAVGKFQTKENLFGMDFSGVDCNGNAVMGVINDGAIASVVDPDCDLLWPVPKYWDMADAATVPLPFVHAYYCLVIKGQLCKQQSVFVNGGAGALGQAVIAVALSQACTVYTTVSDIKKKQFLLRLFPELKENNIGYSGHENFNAMVISNSQNKQCDWVISSLSGSLRSAAMKCVGSFGVFQDVNAHDMEMNSAFGMSFGDKDRNYQAVFLSNIFRPENRNMRKQLQYMISEGISNGTVRPLSRVIYPTMAVSRAFRLISQRKHRGRALLQIRDSEKPLSFQRAIPRIKYSSYGVYIIKCDDTELGIELADRIIRNGARKIVFNIDTPYLIDYLHIKLPLWRKLGVTLTVDKDKIISEDNCKNLLKCASDNGKVEGIFLIQGCFGNEKNFNQHTLMRCYENTASFVSMFDRLSRANSSNLRHFVVINQSPTSCAGAYAVAAAEKICQYRSESGFPALACQIDLNNQSSPKSNIQPLTLKSIFRSLEICMKQNETVIRLTSCSKNQQKRANITEKLASVLGLREYQAIQDGQMLKDLIVDETIVEEIKTFIKDTYQIEFTSEVLENMTLASLKQLDRKKNVKQINKLSSEGLDEFYSFVEKDEYMATDIMIPMKSILRKTNERDDEISEDDTYLFLIPGFEGHHRIFVPMCQSLKIRAMTFQLGPDIKRNSIMEIALDLKKFMMKRFKLTSKFYLLGYSFGINVALELASLFEKDGLKGTVFCLDSSPDLVRENIDVHLGELTDSQLQVSIIEHFFSLMSVRDKSKLNVNLQTMDWTEKMDACVKELKKYATYTSQYTKDVLDSAYKRIHLAKNYDPNFILDSEIILMKRVSSFKSEKLQNDLNLSKYTKTPIKIFELGSDKTAIYDSRVSNIINKSLDRDLLDKCKHMNKCDTYSTETVIII